MSYPKPRKWLGQHFLTDPRILGRIADVLAITTPWAEFREISPKDFKRHGTVLDCWRLLDKDAVGAVVEYLALGFGARESESFCEPALAEVEGH